MSPNLMFSCVILTLEGNENQRAWQGPTEEYVQVQEPNGGGFGPGLYILKQHT